MNKSGDNDPNKIGLTCTNSACPTNLDINSPDYEQPHFKRAGKSGKVQRYQCTICDKKITSTAGTVAHRRRASPRDIRKALIAYRDNAPLDVIAYQLDRQKRTILGWIRSACKKSRRNQSYLLHELQLTAADLDEIKRRFLREELGVDLKLENMV